jgi:hypothetical protein
MRAYTILNAALPIHTLKTGQGDQKFVSHCPEMQEQINWLLFDLQR